MNAMRQTGVLIVAGVLLLSPCGLMATQSEVLTSTLYINKHFEVREHDAPTKYVWNGEIRVARVTGSLKDNVRVQRLRLFPGWNLCSLAVNAAGNSFSGLVSAFRWYSPSGSW